MRRIEQEEWWATAAAKAALFHTIHCLGEYEGKDRRGGYRQQQQQQQQQHLQRPCLFDTSYPRLVQLCQQRITHEDHDD